jgi:hypothetical protein
MTSTAQLVADIDAGLYDNGLSTVKEAVDKRVSSIRKTRSLADFPIGTRVRFNDLTGTRYMVGQQGVISSIKLKKVVVTLDNAIGKYHRPNGGPARTVCPIEILDLV